MKKMIAFIFLTLILLHCFCSSIVHAQVKPAILINEFLPNPDGDDLGYEWIELKNTGDESVDVSGWTIRVAGTTFKAAVTIPTDSAYNIDSQELMLICERNVPDCQIYFDKIAMQNGGTSTDGIQLTDRSGTIVDTVLYDRPNTNGLKNDIDTIANDDQIVDGCQQNESYYRIDDTDTNNSATDFAVTESPTPGKPNLVINKDSFMISEIAPSQGYIEIMSKIKPPYTGWFVKRKSAEEQISLVEVRDFPMIYLETDIPNSDDCLLIIAPNGETADTLCYKKVYSNYSYCRIDIENNPQNVALCALTPSQKNMIFEPETVLISKAQESNLQNVDIKFCFINNINNKFYIVDESHQGLLVSPASIDINKCYKANTDIKGGLINIIYSQDNDLKVTPIASQNITLENLKYITVQAAIVYQSDSQTIMKSDKDQYFEVDGNTYKYLPDILYKLSGVPFQYSPNINAASKIYLYSTSIEEVKHITKTALATSGQRIDFICTFAIIIQSLFIISVYSDRLCEIIFRNNNNYGSTKD